MTAAAVLGTVAVQGLGQLAATSAEVLLDIAAAVAIMSPAVVLWWLLCPRRRGRRVPFPKEELGDDVIAMIRQAREQDRAEAQADATAEAQRRQGDGRG